MENQRASPFAYRQTNLEMIHCHCTTEAIGAAGRVFQFIGLLRDVVSEDNMASDIWADTVIEVRATNAYLRPRPGQSHPLQKAQGARTP